MNEHDESEPTAPFRSAPLVLPATKPFSHWAKRFLICNPFYLVSAALLLFGMYRVSVDKDFFEEIAQLTFNLTSLEFYEMLLVGTAVFLASRRIWYDSTLLVGVENLFVFVPFILLSQVALISTRAVWLVCALVSVLAVIRFVGLKKYFRELNLPNRALLVGLALLAINIGLLAAYRIVGQTKMGWIPDSGRDFEINQFTWLVILPAALALACFLPRAGEMGSLEPQRRWLPAGFFLMWILATGIHLYCLNYVYNFAFHFEMIVPAAWVLAWIVYRRGPEWMRMPLPARRSFAVIALLIPLAAALGGASTMMLFTVTALNAAIFFGMCWRGTDRFLARHLLFASIVLLICSLPAEWIQFITPAWDRDYYIGAGLAVYLLFYILQSRDPKNGVLGAMLVGVITSVLLHRHDAAMHWAMQSGMVFLLLHSLRWTDTEHEGAKAVRVIAALTWMTDTVFWLSSGSVIWMPCLSGGIVLIAYIFVQLLRGRWDLIILPAASVLTVLSGPGFALVRLIERAPDGLLAVIGSFLLFVFGTAAALTKHRWHRSNGTSA